MMNEKQKKNLEIGMLDACMITIGSILLGLVIIFIIEIAKEEVKYYRTRHCGVIKGTVTAEIHSNGDNIIFYLREKRTGEYHLLQVYDFHNIDGKHIKCKISCDVLFEILNFGDFIVVPRKRKGDKYYTDEIQDISHFLKIRK